MNRFFTKLSDGYDKLTGRRLLFLNFLMGGLFVLALPPIGWWFLSLLVLPLLFLSLDRSRPFNRSHAFWRAWAFYFGYFLFGLYWMGYAFLVEAEMFFWLMPFAVTLLPAGLALFYALAASLWWQICHRFQPEVFGRILLVILVMTLADYARGHVLTGFPWNLPGMVALGWLPFAQSAAILGVYGLGVIVWVFGLLPVVAWYNKSFATVLLLLLMVGAGAGFIRVQETPVQDDVSWPRIRIVQPNLAQAEKWDPNLQRAHIRKTINLSRGTYAQKPDLIIWPETAIPVLLDREDELRRYIASVLPSGSTLVTGSLRRLDNQNGGRPKSYNSLFVINDGQITAQYDKHHLVPFGEYLPMQPLLEALGLRQLTQLRGGFEAGAEPALLEVGSVVPFAPFTPMICYEVIFPRSSLPTQRPDWIINVTNDGWFGQTAGPWQHFAMARMRAIEQGLPLARAANTGVSALISPKGQIIDDLALGEAGVIDVALPPALGPTIYARYGDWTLAGLLSLFALAVFILNLRRKDVYRA